MAVILSFRQRVYQAAEFSFRARLRKKTDNDSDEETHTPCVNGTIKVRGHFAPVEEPAVQSGEVMQSGSERAARQAKESPV